MQNNSFINFTKLQGLCYSDKDSKYPTKIHQLFGESNYYLSPGSTYYIYSHSGICWINSKFPVLPKMFASVAAESHLTTDYNAHIIIIERCDYVGIFVLGGPIEREGRLKYIDGCTDSLLIPPVKYGDPCFNHLHFPRNINQTPHTHPSLRAGVVTKGNGLCITPFGNIPLKEGDVFAILPGDGTTAIGEDLQMHPVGTHSFQTTIDEMDVIAYHPDSDFGPTDEEHPMINRTIVNGISAKNINEIKTK